MKVQQRFLLLVGCAIVTFDLFASLASRIIGFEYEKLVWVSLGLYALCGYLGGKYLRIWGGALAGLVAGMADATLGWVVSAFVHPFTSHSSKNHRLGVVVITIILVSFTGSFFGLVGGVARVAVSKFRHET
jgi:hypothetical protein